MRIVRPILLATLVSGIALTLALGPSVVKPTQAGAQTGYGDFGPSGLGSDTVPPRGLFIGAADPSNWNLLLLVLLLVILAVLAAVTVLRRRRSRS